jgi:hypothetical protein
VSDVAEAWQPATELEDRMREAVNSGDQQSYFALLAQADLIIPVSPDVAEEVLANQAQPTWPTHEVDGRLHVLAYTSPEAMHACLGPEVRHFMKLTFGDVAEAWPEAGWWLAVNGGLPIQGLLPSWFIKQVADGDPLPPLAGPPPGSAAAPPGDAVPDAVPDAEEAATTAEPAAGDGTDGTEAAGETAGDDDIADGGTAIEAAAQPEEGGADPGTEADATADGDAEDSATAEEHLETAPADAAPAAEPGPDDGPPPADAAQPQEDVQPDDDPVPGEDVQPEDGPLPGDEPEAAAELEPANDVEQALLRARAEGDEDAFLKALVEAEVLIRVPVDTDQVLRPGRPGFPWQTTDVDGETAIAVFTSPERMVEILGEPVAQGPAATTDFMKFPLASIIRYWPEQAWTLAVDSGTPISASLVGERLPGLAEWADQMVAQRMAEHFAPQNEVEQQLFDAAVRRDIDEFFAILLSAQVLVPADPETPWGIRPDDSDFPWRPVPVQGEMSIQMFTSLKWMHDAIGPSRFVMPTFLDVVSAWPDLGWTLILNPATPIDAAVPGERVRELAAAPGSVPRPADTPLPGSATPPVPAPFPDPVPAAHSDLGPGQPPAGPEPRSLPEFHPGNSTDQELYETAVSGDTDAFLRVLMRTSVLVPIPADAPAEFTPREPRFRWEAALRDSSSVQVFTSHARLRDAMSDAPGPDRAPAGPRFVSVDFRELIGYWPRAEWTMLLNPGTRIGASLRGDQVQALSAWAVRVGLAQQAATAPAQPQAPQPQPWALPPQAEPGPPQPMRPHPAPVHSAPPQATPAQAMPAQPGLAGPFAATADLPGPGPAGPVRVLQKALPHSHVGWYLEQGYDRIGGFVHPATDVTELQTPRQLYEALGLLHPGSPFSPDDEGVYVIRWPVFCGDLYRVPFGGQTDDELRRWGDAGWVVEPPPFHGDGFAPGSAGTIREYKVDSVRLPYGAEMYLLGRDRSERFIAVYDPDRLTWLRPEEDTQADRREQSGVAQ